MSSGPLKNISFILARIILSSRVNFFSFFKFSFFMCVRINIASLGISNIAFPNRRCSCVSYKAALIFLSPESTRKSRSEQCTLFLLSKHPHNGICIRNIAFNHYDKELYNHSKQTRLFFLIQRVKNKTSARARQIIFEKG